MRAELSGSQVMERAVPRKLVSWVASPPSAGRSQTLAAVRGPGGGGVERTAGEAPGVAGSALEGDDFDVGVAAEGVGVDTGADVGDGGAVRADGGGGDGVEVGDDVWVDARGHVRLLRRAFCGRDASAERGG